jgi:serine/threonine protein kinase/Tol biopolymer transport system component
MGQVYRATDTVLKRQVALKVLPVAVAGDPERVARFQREAEILASLNHPHIAGIYGLEESHGVSALVMELVDGEDLSQRLARGAIPIDEALPIAKQIAEALEAAHEQGIIHRDLKPANIKIRPDGTVKVLDFGLAKLAEPAAAVGTATLTQSPTITTPAMTAAGFILGTAAYMSPEQARGKAVDRRADIWAFGCVLFEMLTGTRAFHGGSTSDVLASILNQEPDWLSLPNRTPRAIHRLLRRCLAKDCNERLHDSADARLEITDVLHPGSAEPAVDARADRSDRLRWAAMFAASVVIAGGGAAWWIARSVSAPSEIHLEITTPPSPDPASIAMSPDGRKILFVATLEGRSRLWLRALDSSAARPLAGTEGALYPFWSPDNRSIGFFMQGKLQRLDLDGGLVRALAVAPNPAGGTWGPDGTVLFTPNYTGPIFRTSAQGGDAVPITHTDARQPVHRFPAFLPDGKHFLFFVPSNADTRSIYVGDLDGGAPQRLLESDAPGAYAPSKHLLFVREGKLIAQPFDPARLVLTGNPVSVADQVMAAGNSNSTGLSVSDAGSFIYRAGIASQHQFVWFDRSGKETGRVSEPNGGDAGTAANPSLSPDGRRVALDRTVARNLDVWILDLERSLFSRFTFDAAEDAWPVWSPDGATIAFNSDRSGVYDLYQKSATGVGSEELLLATPRNKGPVDWSPDGRFLLYRSPGATTGFDLWALPLFGDRKPFVVVQTNFEERDGQFSPDGKWIAYQSNESGQTQVLVQPFPGPGGKLQVSTDGGAQVRWRADGRELFYVSPDGRLMAVPIRPAADRRSLEAGAPVPLFATRMGGTTPGINRQEYVVSKDGQRFLVDVAESVASPITVVLNWKIKP